MRLYELDYLISPDIPKKETSSFNKRVQSIIEKEGGKIEKKEAPSKTKLAYPIKEKGQAYLATIIFNLEPEKITSITKLIKKEEDILRHLIFKRKAVQKQEKKKDKKLKKITSPDAKKEKKTKVELKKIEEKLEEILHE